MRGRNSLDASYTLCPRVYICCDILVDALDGDTVVAKIGSRREVEIIDVSSQTGPEPHGKGGLEVAYLIASIIQMKGTQKCSVP